MTINIIFAIVAILIAVSAYYQGKIAGRQECRKDNKNVLNLPSPVDTLSRTVKIPHHYLTRYVHMDKEDMHSTNDAIEMLEGDGFTVDDYDTDDGIITMTKGIYKEKDGEAKVYIVVEVFGGQAEHIIGCFATQEEADAYIRSYSDTDCTATCEEWKIGESVKP